MDAAQPHPACLPIDQLVSQCSFKRTRASGPGGQHRNKVETAIVVVHDPTGIKAQASERRSQNANRQVAIERLRLNLAIQFRMPTLPSRMTSERWNSRRTPAANADNPGRLSVSTQHVDYPAIMAEALDFVAAESFELPAAAKRLAITTSQLIKFLKTSSQAWQWVAGERQKLGLKPLK